MAVILIINGNPETFSRINKFQIGDVVKVIGKQQDKTGLYYPNSKLEGMSGIIKEVLSDPDCFNHYQFFKWDYTLELQGGDNNWKFVVETNIELYQKEITREIDLVKRN